MSQNSLPSQARAVVVGGGIIGCPTAYHLANKVEHHEIPPREVRDLFLVAHVEVLTAGCYFPGRTRESNRRDPGARERCAPARCADLRGSESRRRAQRIADPARSRTLRLHHRDRLSIGASTVSRSSVAEPALRSGGGGLPDSSDFAVVEVRSSIHRECVGVQVLQDNVINRQPFAPDAVSKSCLCITQVNARR